VRASRALKIEVNPAAEYNGLARLGSTQISSRFGESARRHSAIGKR